MIQLCVCRDIEHLGSLGSTQEARNAFGCASSNSYASFVLSKLPASSISLHTHADAWTKGAVINYGRGGGLRAGKFWRASHWGRAGGLRFLSFFGRFARTIRWVLCYWNVKHCLKYDGRASNINRIAYSKLNHMVKKHSDWLEMSSGFTRNRFQFAWLWNGFENSARF